jgi:hypothetical protein
VSDETVAAKVLVKAIQIKPLIVAPWAPLAPLDVSLECWKIWMTRNDGDLGTQRQKLLTSDDGENDEERTKRDAKSIAAAAEQRRDNEIADATDAANNSLLACDRWAIYKMSGLSSVWDFPTVDYMTFIQRAKAQAVQILRINIATRVLFA